MFFTLWRVKLVQARTLSKFAILLFSSVMSLSVAELALRFKGYRPWTYNQPDRNEPTMNEPDPILGWRSKEGSYLVPPYDPSGAETQYSLLASGLRKTSPKQNDTRDSRPKLIVVGCSYTQGWAISDEETYPWKLQNHFTKYEVLNYGNAGYSTYQSLLMLERVLPTAQNPTVVMYGFSDKHEVRNVAAVEWVRKLSMYSKRGHVNVPYVSRTAEGVLIRHAPEAYPSFPLRESSSLVALAESAYAELRGKKRTDDMREVTQRLILEMRDLTQRYGVKFVVVFLVVNEEAKNYYRKFLAENQISMIDCSHQLTDEMIVKGEGHPNGSMNAVWSACITASPNVTR